MAPRKRSFYYENERRRQRPLRFLVQNGDFLHLDLTVLSLREERIVKQLWPELHQTSLELTRRLLMEPENWIIQQLERAPFEPFYKIWRRGSHQGYWYGRGLHMDTLWALWKGAREHMGYR